MILWRLTEDSRWMNLLEGSCITDERLKSAYFTDKALFEPIQEFERADMVEYKNDEYCGEKGVEAVLFYTQNELEKFLKKL